MKKILFLFAVCSALCTTAFAASHSYENFTRQKPYMNQFEDVSRSAWYASAVELGYAYGFMNGISSTVFAPSNNLSLAEAITLACRIHGIYGAGSAPSLNSEAGEPWYATYVRYAAANGIGFAGDFDYTAPAVRSEVAVLFSKALPPEALTEIREVEDHAIPDVPSSASYAESVYLLYRAGILSGNDDYGTFSPNSCMTRAEAAAICVRLAVPSERSSKALVVKTTDTTQFNTAIASVLQEKYRAKVPDGLLHVQSYYLLATERVCGVPKDGNVDHLKEETAYLIVSHRVYRVSEEPEELEGGIVPTAITFSIDENGEYSLKEYWTPRTGPKFESDIRAKFPKAAADDACHFEKYVESLKNDNWNQIMEYWNRLKQE